jgi:flagellar motility protein MotE (MotC chaperone)
MRLWLAGPESEASWSWQNFRLWGLLLIAGLALKIMLSLALFDNPVATPGRSPQAASYPQQKGGDAVRLTRLLALAEKERLAVKNREEKAAAREEQLLALKGELETRFKELIKVQERVLRLQEEEKRLTEERIQHLAATLEAMTPEQAGKLLEKMEEGHAATLLRRLKSKESAQLLNYMTPEKAARLGRRLLEP